MKPLLPKPIIQAAGIKNLNEAKMLIRAGFNSLGFPFALDYHKEDCTTGEAKEIIAEVKGEALITLITYLKDAYDIMELVNDLGAEAVQIHSQAPLDELMILKKTLPNLLIFKSLIVRENNLFELETEMHEYAYLTDAFLTDTFDKSTGASGATGKTHDWRVSKRLAEIAPKPLILSGGLTSFNVQPAIYMVNPFGVDVHTGIEDLNGNKEYHLAKEFVFNAKQALSRN